MYWSDWGDRPLIAHSTMAGANAVDFVNKSIYWPNGIAIDLPSERLYWADAKLMTLESIKFDGTDRRVIEFYPKSNHSHIFCFRLFWKTS